MNVVDPKEDEEGDEFRVGNDEEEADPEDSEESRQWKEGRETDVSLKPKYGLDGEAFENVWGGSEASEAARENP